MGYAIKFRFLLGARKSADSGDLLGLQFFHVNMAPTALPSTSLAADYTTHWAFLVHVAHAFALKYSSLRSNLSARNLSHSVGSMPRRSTASYTSSGAKHNSWILAATSPSASSNVKIIKSEELPICSACMHFQPVGQSVHHLRRTVQ